MRDFTSDRIKEIKPSGIRKFFDIANKIKDCISLGVGEPDFDTPWHITEEGIYSLEQGKTFYTSNQGLPELREEISKWNKRKYNLDYSPENIIVTCGGSEAIDIALRACINPGDEVIILEPNYVCYEPDIILAGGVAIKIKLKNENEFRLTPEELEEVITDKTKILLINYPNNPTGAIMTKEDLEKIAEVIKKHDLLVISDEIYSELTYSGNHYSIGALPDMRDRTITINGFSKAFSMTGWRLGYVMGPKAIMDQMKKIHQFVIMCSPTISQYAGIEALKNGDGDIEKMKKEYDKRRKYLLKEFDRLGLPCFEPRGAFYIFPDIRKYRMTSEEFATDLLEKEHVVVVPGTAFGDSGEGFVRISYAYSLDALKEAVRRIEKYIGSLNFKAGNYCTFDE
ncbi:MAG TPA: aminotransferase class I/II-fold pyridoxal phosphate-dependent enzyme [Fervidobacterium sp.]|jgi:aminotransferase|nr:aminotransferase class I/II-fold pyridoxal phosphate-dependent enzyme [Fervidobacterium sp.]